MVCCDDIIITPFRSCRLCSVLSFPSGGWFCLCSGWAFGFGCQGERNEWKWNFIRSVSVNSKVKTSQLLTIRHRMAFHSSKQCVYCSRRGNIQSRHHHYHQTYDHEHKHIYWSRWRLQACHPQQRCWLEESERVTPVYLLWSMSKSLGTKSISNSSKINFSPLLWDVKSFSAQNPKRSTIFMERGSRIYQFELLWFFTECDIKHNHAFTKEVLSKINLLIRTINSTWYS